MLCRLPFAKVEAVNGDIRAVLRRQRDNQDHEHLLLKVQTFTTEGRRLTAS
jgi:hypothetical protein